MAKRKISDEELLSRREFFRKGAQTALPMLVSIALPSIITSCTPDDDWGCSECSSICSYTCHESCSSTSTSSSCDSCSSSCVNSCSGTCSTTCEGSSQSSSCSGCSNSCSGDCAESCGNSCGNNCSSSCKNSSTSNGGDDSNNIFDTSGTVAGYPYVDLGLSVKWAIYNVGAKKIEDSGTLFNHLPYSNRDNILRGVYLLFGKDLGSGEIVSISGTEYDKVTEQWGGKWCTPTKEQCEELINNCEITEYTLNGVKGTRYKSKKNGKSIFFPNNSKSWAHGCGSPTVVTSSLKLNAYASCLYTFLFTRKEIGIVSFSSGYDDYDKLNVRAVVHPNGGSDGCSDCNSTCTNTSTSSGCYSCGSNCSSSCGSNCSGACVNTCNTGCGKQCRHSCGGTCSQTCAGFCSGGCKGASKGSCSDCTGSCSYLCSKSCSQYCYSSCTNMGVKSL